MPVSPIATSRSVSPPLPTQSQSSTATQKRRRDSESPIPEALSGKRPKPVSPSTIPASRTALVAPAQRVNLEASSSTSEAVRQSKALADTITQSLQEAGTLGVAQDPKYVDQIEAAIVSLSGSVKLQQPDEDRVARAIYGAVRAVPTFDDVLASYMSMLACRLPMKSSESLVHRLPAESITAVLGTVAKEYDDVEFTDPSAKSIMLGMHASLLRHVPSDERAVHLDALIANLPELGRVGLRTSTAAQACIQALLDIAGAANHLADPNEKAFIFETLTSKWNAAVPHLIGEDRDDRQKEFDQLTSLALTGAPIEAPPPGSGVRLTISEDIEAYKARAHTGPVDLFGAKPPEVIDALRQRGDVSLPALKTDLRGYLVTGEVKPEAFNERWNGRLATDSLAEGMAALNIGANDRKQRVDLGKLMVALSLADDAESPAKT